MPAWNRRSITSDSQREEFRPGHLFWMPPGSTWLNRDKPRPFALATPCAHGRLGTLVYGGSQETEQQFGAAFIEVAPVREGLHRNQLRVKTYFYPGTLLPIQHQHLPVRAGFLGRSLDDLKAALRIALGIGMGSCLVPSAPRGSRRGRIVMLHGPLARSTRARTAVVLTEPFYSREAKYQVILPFFDAAARSAGASDLVLSTREWSGATPSPVQEVILPIPVIHSVWHAHAIVRETERVLDEESLRQIDRRLCEYFSLPPDDAAG